MNSIMKICIYIVENQVIRYKNIWNYKRQDYMKLIGYKARAQN